MSRRGCAGGHVPRGSPTMESSSRRLRPLHGPEGDHSTSRRPTHSVCSTNRLQLPSGHQARRDEAVRPATDRVVGARGIHRLHPSGSGMDRRRSAHGPHRPAADQYRRHRCAPRPGWVCGGCATEPPHGPGRIVHRWFREALGRSQRLDADVRPRARQPGTLYAFYDLSISDHYDSAWSLWRPIASGAPGLDRVHVRIVPASSTGCVKNAPPTTPSWIATSALRVHNIVLPVLASRSVGRRLHVARVARSPARSGRPPGRACTHRATSRPSRSVTIPRRSSSRAAGETAWPCSAALCKRNARGAMDGTAVSGPSSHHDHGSDYAFHDRRNSNLEAWVTFARRLDPARYRTVFIPGTERTLDPCRRPSSDTCFGRLRGRSPSARSLRTVVPEPGRQQWPILMAALGSGARLLVFKMITPSVPQTTKESCAGSDRRSVPAPLCRASSAWWGKMTARTSIEREFTPWCPHRGGGGDA